MLGIVSQVINAIVNHIPAFFIVAGILFLFLALFDVDIKPPTVKPASKLDSVRKMSIGLGILFVLVGLPFQILPSVASNSQGASPNLTATVRSTPTAPAISTSQDVLPSRLIPAGQQPVINDPLKDNSGGYEWDIQDDANGSCNFVQGHYLLNAPAGVNNGVGCQAESPRGTFGNFVYQIQMIILMGIDNDSAGAGPTFRTNTSGTGQQYQVLFDVNGNWQVSTDVKPLTGGSCANPCPHFHTGWNQVNTITLRASGNFIQIQINGYDLGSYTDNTYSSGAIGVQMDPGTDSSSVAFSNVQVWQL